MFNIIPTYDFQVRISDVRFLGPLAPGSLGPVPGSLGPRVPASLVPGNPEPLGGVWAPYSSVRSRSGNRSASTVCSGGLDERIRK